ncbi:MAG: hypothetical protein N2653_14165 [Burkholderiales bacterium]|nr:hypothetical protein [Burkholderiales bacterium]
MNGRRGGRKPGAKNRITRAFKEAVLRAYDAIGGDSAFAEWARANPGDFYRIASRLIPPQREDSGGTQIRVIVGLPSRDREAVVVEAQRPPALPDGDPSR